MKPVGHQYEDKLLEFAYGELPAHEASAVDAHVKTCQRCTAALAQITSVRSAMSVLPAEPVPDKGLDSLLAYAEQAARRNASQAVVPPFWSKWRRFVAPLAGVAAMALVGVVFLKVNGQLDLSKEGAAQEKVKRADDARVAPVVAEAAPSPVPSKPAAAAAPNELAEESGRAVQGKVAWGAKEAEAEKAAAEPKAEYKQRDDKEAGLFDEVAKAPTKALSVKAAKPAPKPAMTKHSVADQSNAEGYFDQGGKGGGGRELANTNSKNDSAYGLGTGPGGSGLGTQLGNADRLSDSKVGLKSAIGGTGDSDLAKDQPLNKRNAPADDGSQGFSPKAKVSKKKSREVVPAGNEGGADLQVATGSLSSAAPAKPAEKVTESKVAKLEAKPSADKAEAPAKEQQALEYGSASRRGGEQSGSSARQQVATVQQEEQAQQAYRQLPAPVAQQAAPPPPAQPSSSGPSSLGLGIGTPKSYRAPSTAAGEEDISPEVSIAQRKGADQSDLMRVKQSRLSELMKAARAAENANDLREELRLSLEVLKDDAQGDLRAEALYRSCQAYGMLGDDDKAAPYCSMLQSQFPNSKWAAQVRYQQKSPAPRANEQRAKKAAPYERSEPAAAPPPQQPTSKPSQAVDSY